MALGALVALALFVSRSYAVTLTDGAAFAADTFDYIVVGSGSAGLTVRSPLSIPLPRLVFNRELPRSLLGSARILRSRSDLSRRVRLHWVMILLTSRAWCVFRLGVFEFC